MSNIKYLYTNGASFTQGFGLSDIKNERHSAILAKHYGWEDYNYAMIAGSNERIVRTTLNWLAGNKNKVDETFYLIGICPLERFELYFKTKNMFLQCGNDLISFLEGREELEQDSFAEYAEIGKTFWKNYLIHFFTEEMIVMKTLQNIILLQSVFKSIGAPHLFYNAQISCLDYRNEKMLPRNSPFNSRIDWSDKLSVLKSINLKDRKYESKVQKNLTEDLKWSGNYINDLIDLKYFYTGDHTSYEEFCMSVNRNKTTNGVLDFWVSEDDGHPNAKYNKLWAEELLPYIEEIINDV